MCYAIPGRVERIEGRIATVRYFDETRRAVNEMQDLAPGDYVYAQGGFVISKVAPAEAEAALALWKEAFALLRETDVRLSRRAPAAGVSPRLARTLDRAAEGRRPDPEDLLFLLRLEDPAERELLRRTANFLRQKHHGNACCVHGIVEISNVCSSSCRYCGISTRNEGLPRYRMDRGEVLAAVREAVEGHGFKALVLQSGEDGGRPVSELAALVREIRRRHAVLVFVSFGEVGAEGLRELYDAGARGLLMRFETSNPRLYGDLHPGCRLEDRLAEIRTAYDLGYLIVTGGLIGLPGQTDEDVLADILLVRDLRTEMVSMGPFIPHPATPLAGSPPPDPERVLSALAVCRLAMPETAKILVTTGLETLGPDLRRRGLLSGASSVMLNATPAAYRPLYAIYPDRAHERETVGRQIEETIALLKDLGRAPTDLGV